MSCVSVLEVFIAEESASLIVIRARFMDLFTQNARKGEIWLAKRKQDHKINIILICLRTTMRVFAHAPLLIATYIWGCARSIPTPAATKPFVRACLFLRAWRVWPCLAHHLGLGLEVFVQLPRWQNARLLFVIHSICVCSACRSFSRFIMSPLLSQLCLYTIPYYVYTILDMCFPSLILFLFELFNYLLVFFFLLFFFFFMFFCSLFVAHLSGFAFCFISSLYW